MNLYQLRYFLAVVETGGFTRAAERAFVTQPTLSTGIAKLEAELGAALFERRGRRVTLTPAGSRLLPRARAVLQECAAAKAEIHDEAPRPERLRLGVLVTIPAARLGRLLADFSTAHGSITIELREGAPASLARALAEGRIDAALTALSGERDKAASAVLARETYGAALAEADAVARKPTLRADDLDGRPFIVRGACEAANAVRAFFASHQVRPHTVFRTDDDDRAMALVAAGLGLAIVPEGHRRPGVVTAPVAGLTFARRLGLVWRPAAHSDVIELFRHLAVSHDWLAEPVSAGRLEWAR